MTLLSCLHFFNEVVLNCVLTLTCARNSLSIVINKELNKVHFFLNYRHSYIVNETRSHKRGLMSLWPTGATGTEVRDIHCVLHLTALLQLTTTGLFLFCAVLVFTF